MRALAPLLALCLSLPALAVESEGYGGGGFTLHQSWIPQSVSRDLVSPGSLRCIGGMGFGVEDALRIGGEGQACGGPDAGMVYGGGQFGWHDGLGPIYGAAYGVVGGGWLGVDQPGEAEYGVGFAYIQPTAAIGFSFGWGALEFGAYWMQPFPLVAVTPERLDTPLGLWNTGGRLTVLFGDFRPERIHGPEPLPPRPAPPAAPPEEEEEDRPLAIPEADQPREPR